MKLFTVIVLSAIFGGGALAANAQTKRIGMARAAKIASARVHGTIKSRELEKEHGRWIYSFDIRTGRGKITEVNVDAYTGRVIGVEHETAAGEAKEVRDEKKGKH